MDVRVLFIGIFVSVSLSTASHVNFTDLEEPVDSLDNSFLAYYQKDDLHPHPLDKEENKNVSAGDIYPVHRSFLRALEDRKKVVTKKLNKTVNGEDTFEDKAKLKQHDNGLNVSTRALYSSSQAYAENGKTKAYNLYSSNELDTSDEAPTTISADSIDSTDSTDNSSSFASRTTDSSASELQKSSNPSVEYYSHFYPTEYFLGDYSSLQPDLSMYHQNYWPLHHYIGDSYGVHYPEVALPQQYSQGGVYSASQYSNLQPQYLQSYSSLYQGGQYSPYSNGLASQRSQQNSQAASGYSQQYNSQGKPNSFQQYLQAEPSSYDSSQFTPGYSQTYSQTHYQPAAGVQHAQYYKSNSYQVDPASSSYIQGTTRQQIQTS